MTVMRRYYQIEVVPRCLTFKRPAGTSRGVYTTRKLWEVRIRKEDEPSVIGIGECAPLPDLSCDYGVDYEITLSKACLDLEQKGYVDTESLRHYPSILFGLETAMRHYEQGGWRHYDTPFSQGQAGIPINGLIWMGDYKYMLEQVEEKMKEGFRCVKLKIGAIDFDRELSLLKHIRAHFSAKEIELRVDANGAFTPSEAMDKLKRLAEMDLHSIEQPIRAGQLEEMARLAAESPLPIALDEELIGCNAPDEKRRLLETIHPQYIILKPSLHRGEGMVIGRGFRPVQPAQGDVGQRLRHSVGGINRVWHLPYLLFQGRVNRPAADNQDIRLLQPLTFLGYSQRIVNLQRNHGGKAQGRIPPIRQRVSGGFAHLQIQSGV